MNAQEQYENAAMAPRPARVVNYFSVPKSLADATGITEVGMVELTSSEELMCAERSRGSQVRLGVELVKESVRRVNGRLVSSADGSVDQFWDQQKEGMSFIRQMLLAAYGEVHNPKVDELKAFLSSRSARV